MNQVIKFVLIGSFAGIVSAQLPSTVDEINWQIDKDSALESKAINLKNSYLEEFGHPKTAVVLLNDVSIEFSGEKVVKRVDEIVWFTESDQIQLDGAKHIYWNLNNQTLTLKEAYVLLDDGTKIKVTPNNVEIIDTNSYDVFTDSYQVIIQPPGLDKGSLRITSYILETNSSSPKSSMGFVESFLPIYKLNVTSTSDSENIIFESDSPHLKCDYQDKTHICQASNIPAWQDDKRIYYMDHVASYITSQEQSWQDIIDKTASDVKNASLEHPEIDQIVNLAKQSEDPIAYLHEFVSQQIRYVSFSRENHSVTPHTTSETINNRYGDCKDKSTLMIHMLKKLDVEAYPVLVATERQNPKGLLYPTPNYFDHMLVCMIDGTKERCIDPTDNSTSAETLSAWVQNKVRLNITKSAIPTTMPHETYPIDISVTNDLFFNKDGSQNEVSNVVFTGNIASWLRANLVGIASDEQNKWLLELYADVVGKNATTTVSFSSLDIKHNSISVKYETTYEGVADTMLPIQWNEKSYWIQDDLTSSLMENEYYPEFRAGRKIEETYNYYLNGIWENPMPIADIDYNTPYGKFTQTYTQTDKLISGTNTLTIPRQNISLDDKSKYNQLLDYIWQDSSFRFTASIKE